MIKPLNALILDDSPDDAALLLYELRRGGFEVNYALVDNPDDLKAALRDRTWDIILSDYSMPSFDAPDALKIVRTRGIDLPFIIISGTVGEDVAVAAMKAGASDFFSKGKLTRLIPTVERELREYSERLRRDEAEARFATIFQRSPIGIVITRLSDKMVVDVNNHYLETYGLTREQMIGKVSSELELQLKQEYTHHIRSLLRETGSARAVEAEYQLASGRRGYALISAEIIELDHEACVLSMLQDITERKNSEQALRESEEKFRLLAENSTDVIATSSPDNVFRYVSPSCLTTFGYTPEELIDHTVDEFLHPDDAGSSVQLARKITEQPETTITLTHRRQHKDGRYIWCETTLRAVRDPKSNAVLEIQASSRDITQRKEAEDSVRQYAERLELLHEIDRSILRLEQPRVIAEAVLSRLQALIGFDSASVFVFDADFHEFTTLAAIAPIADYSPFEDPPVLDLLKRGDVYLVEDLLGMRNLPPSDHRLITAGIRSYMRVPLVARGKLLGSFHLRALEPRAFSSQAVLVAKEVGVQLAIAIENARLVEVEQRRTRELSALHQASLQLTSSLDVKYILNLILDYVILLIQANNAHLFLYDGEKLTFGAALWQGDRRSIPVAEPRTNGVTYTVARSGERLIIPNVNQHPIYRDWQWGGAILAVPLRYGSNVMGVMSVSFIAPHDFDQQEIRVVELLADQAAIAIHNAQLYQEIQGHAADLEQRVQDRTHALQASEEKYRSLIEFAPDSVVIVDANGLITLANKRVEETFGYSRQELIGRSFEVVLPASVREQLVGDPAEYLVRLNEQSAGTNFDLAIRHKNGIEIPAKVGLSPITTGTETFIMAYIVDVTADKQLEASLRAALANEKELNQLKTSFTSIVSHEFRTPLSVILSSTELLSVYGERMDLNRRLEKLENITRQVRRLIQLLDDVLMITRSESTGFTFKPAMLNVLTLCEEVLEDIRVGYRQNVAIEFVHEGDCSAVRTDEFLLRRIVQNLVSNAVKYSNDDGVVRVLLNCSDTALTLQVEDHGIGIPERDQSRLFEVFQRAANVGKIQGTGIGLSIVRRAVDACGGTIAFTSVEGKGTTFSVHLPISGGQELTTANEAGTN